MIVTPGTAGPFVPGPSSPAGGPLAEPINPKAWLWYHTVIGGERCRLWTPGGRRKPGPSWSPLGPP